MSGFLHTLFHRITLNIYSHPHISVEEMVNVAAETQKTSLSICAECMFLLLFCAVYIGFLKLKTQTLDRHCMKHVSLGRQCVLYALGKNEIFQSTDYKNNLRMKQALKLNLLCRSEYY